MPKAVIGIANTVGQVEFIIERLQNQATVPLDDISVLVPDTSGLKDVGHVKTTKVPEGAAAGAVAGGITGGSLGLLAGFGTLAVPGLGALIAAGPIMAALSGAAAGAATGGVVGALIGFGIPEHDAKLYENKLKDGNFLIAVHDVDGKQSVDVQEILKQEGATDVSKVDEDDA